LLPKAALEISQYHDPLCSSCQNQVTPKRVFSAIAMGKYFSVDQLPMLPADACDQLVLRFSTNPHCDGRRECH